MTQSDGTVADEPVYGRENRRVILATMVGTTIEWYDFFIYANCAALVFADVYFKALGSEALLISFATIGISFLFRPLGAVIAGHLGDILGRKMMLVVTLLLMGLSTVLIGFIPTPASIGAWAPVILLLLRILQGLSAGGEWGGAALLAVEHAPKGRRGFFGAFPQIGVPIGLLLATGMLALVNGIFGTEGFVEWAWRIPFWASIVLIVFGILIRTRVAESPVFEEMKKTKERATVPLVPLFRFHWALVIAAALLFAANNAVGYMTTGGYIQSYSTKVLHVDQTQVLLVVMVSAVAWLVFTLWGGALSDRFGRTRIYQVGFAVQLIWMFPFFFLVNTANIWLLLVGLIIFSVGLGFTYGPQPALYSEMFPANVRYSGAAISYGVGAVIGGAFAPTIAQWLQTNTGTVYSVGVYLAIVTAIGLVVSFLVRDRSNRPLTEAADPMMAMDKPSS